MLTAYLNTKCVRPDGSFDCYLTQRVPVKTTELPHKGQTATGYGCALPTRYMVIANSRWHRVKAICYSNAATLYVSKVYSQLVTITIERD